MTWNRFLRGSCWFGMEQNWSHAKLDGTESHCDPVFLITFGNWGISNYHNDKFWRFFAINKLQSKVHSLYVFSIFHRKSLFWEIKTFVSCVHGKIQYKFHKKTLLFWMWSNGIFLQNCSDLLWEKKCYSDREKLLKFEAEGHEFQKFWDH